MPRSTQPRVWAAPPVAIDDAVKSISCSPSLYCCVWLLQPENGSTTNPLLASMVNALKVPAAGVQAQPSPKVEVPMSCGLPGSVTSRYLSDTELLVLE